MLSIQNIAAVLAMLLALKAISFKALPCAVQTEKRDKAKRVIRSISFLCRCNA